MVKEKYLNFRKVTLLLQVHGCLVYYMGTVDGKDYSPLIMVLNIHVLLLLTFGISLWNCALLPQEHKEKDKKMGKSVCRQVYRANGNKNLQCCKCVNSRLCSASHPTDKKLPRRGQECNNQLRSIIYQVMCLHWKSFSSTKKQKSKSLLSSLPYFGLFSDVTTDCCISVHLSDSWKNTLSTKTRTRIKHFQAKFALLRLMRRKFPGK